MASNGPTLLRQLVEERGWRSYDTFRRHFEDMARTLAADRREPQLADYTVSRTQYDRWLKGGLARRPYPAASLILQALFGTPVHELLGPEKPQSGQLRAPSAGLPPLHGIESEIIMSGHESSEHAASASRSVEETSIEQLQDDIAHVARRYPFTPVYQSFVDARRVRDLAYILQERTALPAQESNLHVIIGQACSVLSVASFDLGFSDAATEQARAAYVHAKMVGHAGMCAWSLGMRALICNWNERPYDALELIGKGLAVAPEGTPTLRLRAIQARAYAHLGDSSGARDAARLAHAAAESSRRDPLHDEVGGEFSFDGARLARCLGSAWVRLGEPEPAIAESHSALEIYDGLPASARMPKVEVEAHIDLAHAYLIQGSLDAAEDSLATVFSVSPDNRIEGVTSRLVGVRGRLTLPQFRSELRAVALARQIEDFTAVSVKGSIPALGPGQ